ncbi:MAG: DUF1232 domain-containing protein [Desulfobacterales bacterium]|nr:DUF1232 domain-containing protein [Desulfobacterales bacterium]MDD4072512.1 DUF1232 domain-containing protein [Desulfobacterales bacterium]MDD4393711.1 DUF1232 domain-containing protein [Desulfobacterales bacterium]
MPLFLDKLKLIIPLIKDYCTGKYRKIPFLSILGIFLAILYIINPLDLIPDYLLGIGQIDDAAVMALCLFLLDRDLEEYKEWKISHPSGGKS